MPVEVECDFCGETVSRPPSVVERAEHHFYDKTCYMSWRSEEEDNRIDLNATTVERTSNDTKGGSTTIRQTPSVAIGDGGR